MRIWLKTSVNSILLLWIAGSARVTVSAEYRRLMWGAAMASEACLVGIQRERHDLLGSKVMWEGGRKRCLWSLSKWGAFAGLGRGENEWEASCEADRHTCRFDSKDKCSITAGSTCTTLHPPRSKSVDSIQPLVLLERTKADLKRCFKDKTGVLWRHCCVFRCCFETYEWTAASWEGLVRLSHSRHHLSEGLCANWHCEHRGAPRQAAVTGKMIRHVVVRAFIIRETAQITGPNSGRQVQYLEGGKPF